MFELRNFGNTAKKLCTGSGTGMLLLDIHLFGLYSCYTGQNLCYVDILSVYS